MRASLAASTVTPGSTAPVGSLTVPVIDACASTIRGARITNAIVHSHLPRAGTSAPSLRSLTTLGPGPWALGLRVSHRSDRGETSQPRAPSPKPRAYRRQKLNVTLNRTNRGARIVVGLFQVAPFAAPNSY